MSKRACLARAFPHDRSAAQRLVQRQRRRRLARQQEQRLEARRRREV
jgi:hypothetical protein